MRVLFVDDEPLVGMALSRFLDSYGIDLECASNADSFWRSARSREHAAIVFDVSLGWARGSKLCTLLRKGGDRRPMFLTSHLYSCEEGNALAKKCGATAFVGKEPTAILAALEPVTGRVPILSYEHAFTDDAIAIDLRDESVIVKKSRVSLPKLQLGALAYLLEKAPDTIGVGDLQDKVWKRTVARSAISKVIGQLIDRFPVWIERVDRGYRARVKTK